MRNDTDYQPTAVTLSRHVVLYNMLYNILYNMVYASAYAVWPAVGV